MQSSATCIDDRLMRIMFTAPSCDLQVGSLFCEVFFCVFRCRWSGIDAYVIEVHLIEYALPSVCTVTWTISNNQTQKQPCCFMELQLMDCCCWREWPDMYRDHGRCLIRCMRTRGFDRLGPCFEYRRSFEQARTTRKPNFSSNRISVLTLTEKLSVLSL